MSHPRSPCRVLCGALQSTPPGSCNMVFVVVQHSLKFGGCEMFQYRSMCASSSSSSELNHVCPMRSYTRGLNVESCTSHILTTFAEGGPWTVTALPEEQAVPQDPSHLPASSAELQRVTDPADGVNDMDRVQETLGATGENTASTWYCWQRIRTSKIGTDALKSTPVYKLWQRSVGVPNHVLS